ncbi:MAG: thioredoxin family protein, partial [Deltaproteobacteria bacterium]|nr:thioredoxin family protein [Deltaproteobacteria bacterium]
MTEVGKKIAVVVNGDTQRESWAHHQQNVDRSIGVLEKQGYEVFCLNTERPRGVDQDHYFSSTQEGLRALKEKLQLKTGADTDLVIYTTGHGYRIKEQGTLCLSDGCDADTVASVFDKIPYSQRTVIMDQCYSGNWNKIFLDDPKTLFVSGGGKNETDSCQEIAPAFWAGNVPDVNGDGVISWQERYAHALAYPVFHSVPQFVPSEGYRQEGAPPFSKEVVTVEDKNALQEQLKKIKPGQYAIITFSASWCGACRGYKPVFDRLASEGGGQHLWLRTEDESLAQDWNLPGFPTVVIVDATGHRFIVDENQRNDIPKVLADFTLSTEDRFSRRLAAIEGIGNEEARLNQLMDFAVALAASDIQDQAAFFNKLTTVAEGFQTPGICANVLTVIASTLVQSKVMEEKEEIFKSLVTIANMNIQDLQERAVALGGISVCLCRSKSDWGISLFEEAITLARGILDP